MNEKKIQKKVDDVMASVFKTISQENVTMRSRYYFLAKSALWLAAMLFVFAATVYVVSLIVFIVSGEGIHVLLRDGMPGAFVAMRSLPWLLILLAVILIGLLEFLSAKFEFVYRRQLIYSLVGAVVAVVALGALTAQTRMHQRALELSEQRRLPLMGPMYRHYKPRPGERLKMLKEERMKYREVQESSNR